MPSAVKTLNYGLASFLIVLCAAIGAYHWAT
jgi:hypothetical protein